MNGLQPNFFIIGAPKCGTTSMSVYLSSHPEIIISNPKEPHYFSKDINNGGIRKMQEYLECFSSVDKKANAIGEASTLYLYSKVAVPNILAFNKDVRFIVMLRNPKEVAYSYHESQEKHYLSLHFHSLNFQVLIYLRDLQFFLFQIKAQKYTLHYFLK